MTPRELAYRVPFELERRREFYRLVNVSAEVVHGVSFTLHGPGVMAVSPARALRPGHGLEVTIAVRSTAALLVVRWFRPNGIEYLWRVAL